MLRIVSFLLPLLLLGCKDSENQPTPNVDNSAPKFFIERKLGDYWYRSDTLSQALPTLDTLRFTSTSSADSFIWTLNQRTYYGNPAIVVGWVGNRPAKLRGRAPRRADGVARPRPAGRDDLCRRHPRTGPQRHRRLARPRRIGCGVGRGVEKRVDCDAG